MKGEVIGVSTGNHGAGRERSNEQVIMLVRRRVCEVGILNSEDEQLIVVKYAHPAKLGANALGELSISQRIRPTKPAKLECQVGTDGVPAYPG